jgi:hypothetical protein
MAGCIVVSSHACCPPRVEYNGSDPPLLPHLQKRAKKSTAINRPLQLPVLRAYFPLAIICALFLEANAIAALFDGYWDCQAYNKTPNDPDCSPTGRIGHHNVVLAYMPEAGNANGAAASAFPVSN